MVKVKVQCGMNDSKCKVPTVQGDFFFPALKCVVHGSIVFCCIPFTLRNLHVLETIVFNIARISLRNVSEPGRLVVSTNTEGTLKLPSQ